MRIGTKDIRAGTQVLCDIRGPLAIFISVLMWVFLPYWRSIKRKPFHVGFISRLDQDKGWMVCEAVAGGIVETPLSQFDLTHVALYRWFDVEPSGDCVDQYLQDHLGCPYDMMIYFWTISAELWNVIFHVNIGRWDNDAYDCWENLEEFNEWCGKPMCKAHKTVMITDFCKALGIV